MKSTIFSIALTMAVLSSKAQFTFHISNKFITGSASELELIGKGYVKNTGSDTATFVWVIDKSMVVPGWGSTICDKNLCYDTSVYSSSFGLMPGDSGVLSVYAYPFLKSGFGRVAVSVYKQGDSNGAIKDTVYFSVWTLGIEDNQIVETKIFPVPATNQLFMDLRTAFPVKITIFNSLGQEQLQVLYSDKETPLNIEKLSSGVYYLTYFHTDGTPVSKQFLKQ